MADAKLITIVGGGLAGLTLGIGLRQRDVPVVIYEAGNYPRHRVCGEFISGRGQGTLARLNLRELLEQAGAVSAQTTAFFSTTKSTIPRALPSSAIGLSRFTLDAALLSRFRELGGELLEGKRFAGDFGDGIVRATGRRAQAEESGLRWFGLKIHARKVALAADLEMHVSPLGYVAVSYTHLFVPRTHKLRERKPRSAPKCFCARPCWPRLWRGVAELAGGRGNSHRRSCETLSLIHI